MESKSKLIALLGVIFLLITNDFTACYAQLSSNKVDAALDYSLQKLEDYVSKYNPGQYPIRTNITNYQWEITDRYAWPSGYFVGALWLMYQYSKSDEWKVHAMNWTEDIKQFHNSENTDLAARIFYSSGLAYKFTDDQSYVSTLQNAADDLLSYYDNTVQAIQCFPTSWSRYNFCVVTDFLLHMQLLFMVAELTDNQYYYDVAMNHINKTLKYNQRGNGSFYHVSDFNDQGELIDRNQGFIQGFDLSSDSLRLGTWSRGQAWAVKALPALFNLSNDSSFLEAAKKAADYMIVNSPKKIYGDDDLVPYCDYLPDRNRYGNGKDASAAAIAASGMYELARLTDELKYKNEADSIVDCLINDYMTKDDPHSYESILKRALEMYEREERGLIYADYFFIEALILAKGDSLFHIEKVNNTKKSIFDYLTVYPNPTSSVLHVNSRTMNVKSLSIYNAKGVKIQETNKLDEQNTTVIDVSGFQPGLYFLRITMDNGNVEKRKFIKNF